MARLLHISRTLLLALLLLTAFEASLAQQGRWSTEFGGELALDGAVWDLAFDESGRLYVGGVFRNAGGDQANGIARWSESGWEALGNGLRYVWAADLVGEDLVIAGNQSSAWQLRVMRRSGNQWEDLGVVHHGCCDGPGISAFAADARGGFYAAGYFEEVEGVRANGVAYFDGSEWHPLGSGMAGPYLVDTQLDQVHALALEDTLLYAGGRFTQAGDTTAVRIARWNGRTWEPLGGDSAHTLSSNGARASIRSRSPRTGTSTQAASSTDPGICR